ncbi:15622_t:CDS:2, partial [Entrophospora sp. SA101]
SDKLQAFLNGLPTQIRMFTELAIPRGFREAWEQAKKVESTLRKDNPFNNDNLQHINTLVANQVTQLGQNVNALAMEIREVAVVQREQLSQQQGRNYQQRTNNNQQQPRRVLLNQEYYKEQQEPQYYTEYQPQMKILEAKENGKAIQYPILFEKEPKEVILEGNELYEDEVLQEEAAYF